MPIIARTEVRPVFQSDRGRPGSRTRRPSGRHVVVLTSPLTQNRPHHATGVRLRRSSQHQKICEISIINNVHLALATQVRKLFNNNGLDESGDADSFCSLLRTLARDPHHPNRRHSSCAFKLLVEALRYRPSWLIFIAQRPERRLSVRCVFSSVQSRQQRGGRSPRRVFEFWSPCAAHPDVQ